jgi:hypothetical protein
MTENKQGLHFAWYTGARNSGSFYAGTKDNGKTIIDRDNITKQGSHPQLTSLTNNSIAIAWDESFETQDGYTRRIGMQLRNPNGTHLLKEFITGDSLYATYPVVCGVKENAVAIAYCVKKKNKNYIAYQRVNFIASKDHSY